MNTKHGGLRWRKRLTPEHIAFIEANYTTMTLSEMAKELKVTYHDVMIYCNTNNLNFKRAVYKNSAELPADVQEFILDNHKKISIMKMADYLNIKEWMVRNFIERNGLERVSYHGELVPSSTGGNNFFDVMAYARECATI